MVVTPIQQAGVMAAQIAQPPFVDRFARKVGSQLTPQLLTPLLQLADTGYLWQLADLLDELRETDPHLHSVLAKREMQVAGADYELRPPEGSGDLGDQIATWCAARLNEIEAQTDYGKSFVDALSELMGAVYYGRSGIEVVWRNEGRYWIPDALDAIHPRRFSYATDWRLHLWDATGEGSGYLGSENIDSPFGKFPGVPLDAFPRGKFIIHRPRIKGGHPTREGLGRQLCWYVLFKKWTVRDWLALAEWAGRGLRVGTYAAGKDGSTRAVDEDVAALQSALDSMSSTTSVVIPDTTQIEVTEAGKQNRLHEQLVLLCNTEISKSVLGETLSTEVGLTGGNRALGDVHNEVRLAVARADARSLARTIRRDLLTPMVRMSFGPKAPVPEIAFSVDPREDLDAVAARVAKLVKDAGLQVSQKWLRNTLQIQDPEPGDELMGGLGIYGQTHAEPDADDKPSSQQDDKPAGDKRPLHSESAEVPKDQTAVLLDNVPQQAVTE